MSVKVKVTLTYTKVLEPAAFIEDGDYDDLEEGDEVQLDDEEVRKRYLTALEEGETDIASESDVGNATLVVEIV